MNKQKISLTYQIHSLHLKNQIKKKEAKYFRKTLKKGGNEKRKNKNYKKSLTT